ncbi:dolichyldiphosphatase [Kwoniella heveanensis CBS 569]|uniref:Dolichyldiphosphatase n=1 Tax=Kwoniella heveanensis BCC8398 TaxID=1296120 RepID=A0A1B9GQG0_9TREE|nr:dolichyldiphosphatase [Kwoniella heveanensis BCC8398]OCF42451.1 dolichyldiphosphatase [Kwoniella heveanensis CBS 569]
MTSLDPNKALSPLPPLKSFSLTHILYDPTHPLSIPLTLLSLSPIFLFVSYFTLLIFNRNITIFFLAAGQLANEVLSWILKRLLKGDRPYIGYGEVGTGYGMPSSHSQAAGFLLAWGMGYTITLAKRTRPPTGAGAGARAEPGANGLLGIVRSVRNGIYLFGLLVWSLGVSYSRYHLHYHSPIQIIAGYLAGLSFGATYFFITEYYPLHHPTSLVGQLRSGVESLWEGIGGVGGWEIGDARGGWGEGWVFLGHEESASGAAGGKSSLPEAAATSADHKGKRKAL